MDKPRQKALILSGTPASGKDTITDLLELVSGGQYCLLKKHKSMRSPQSALRVPRKAAYHLVDEATFRDMICENRFVQYHYRYGQGYGVAREELEALGQFGQIPVIHNGLQENLPAFLQDGARIEVFSVLLISGQSSTRDRILARNGHDAVDLERRLCAYGEERKELADHLRAGHPFFHHLAINTGLLKPDFAARMIISAAGAFWSCGQEAA